MTAETRTGTTASSRGVRVAAAVVVQALLLGVAVWASLAARFTGDEVLLRVGVADSWELNDDAYVRLDYPDLPGDEHYPEGEVSEEEVEAIEDEQGLAFVPLTREGETWVGGEVVREEPSDGLFLRCDDSQWQLRCGIETAYLATGSENDAVRDALRTGDALATVRVDGSGHAALMSVTAGG
jgi:uncharacterized membrane-anchored protein